jgi:hypothetical protein
VMDSKSCTVPYVDYIRRWSPIRAAWVSHAA